MPIASNTPDSAGFSLLEVLVALIILAVGLFGFATMQMRSIKDNHSAYLRSQATVLANDILDRMRANREDALNGEYDIDFGEAPSGPAKVTNDLQAWKDALNGTLPGGDGKLDVNSTTALVQIRWTDTSENGTATLFETHSRL